MAMHLHHNHRALGRASPHQGCLWAQVSIVQTSTHRRKQVTKQIKGGEGC